MKPTSQEAEYANKIAVHEAAIEIEQENIKALKASAKDAGLNVRAIGKAAKELRMAPEKLSKRIEDEAQLDLLRDALGITKQLEMASLQNFVKHEPFGIPDEVPY